MRRPAADVTAGLVAAALACAVTCGGATADDGAAGRGSGLVPTPRKTREELVREWDLNSDGKIDPGEAEVAASRMRRERAQLRLNSGIDPVTGRPRDEAVDDVEPSDSDLDVEPEGVPADEADPDAAPALPGTRAPRPQVPTPTVPRANARIGAGPTADAGTRADADRARQPLTGGVRAGGLPARAGYGAGVPAAPLNAGLPVAPRPQPATRPQQPARAGLVPARRPAPPSPSRPPVSRDLYDPH